MYYVSIHSPKFNSHSNVHTSATAKIDNAISPASKLNITYTSLFKVSEYLFFLEIEKYCFFFHKTMEKPYLNLHFKFHDFFPRNNEDMKI